MKTLAALVFCVIAPLALSQPPVPTTPTSQPGVAKPPMSQPAPPEYVRLLTATMDGMAVALPGNHSGKLVLVHVWATWCPSCAREVPFWKEAYTRFHDRGVEFLGIPTDKNRGTPEDRVRAGVQRHGLTWPQVYEDGPSLSLELGADTIPMSFLVDGDTGEVFFKGNVVRKKNLAKRIEESLLLKAQRDARRKTAATSRRANPPPSRQPR